MPLVHLASRLYGTPLLIARTKLDTLLAVLGNRIGLPAPQAAPPLPPPRPASASRPGIALIPVHGTLVRRTLGLEAASGLTSYAEIATALDAALADPQVRGILLDVDSPGGEAGGVFELAERIRAASRIKPVWAHANDSAFSAAYALAAGAERLTLSRTGGVGSIGVIALHVDQSVKDVKDGLSYTAIHAGAHKNDFSPHEPLSPQATSALQAEVDRLYGLFVDQVAVLRGLDPEVVRATEAGLFFGEHAVAAGLADAVAGLDQVLADFEARLRPPTGAARTARRLDAQTTTLALEHAMPDAPTTTTHFEAETAPDTAPATDPASDARREAQAIAELCLIAGSPQRTAEFLAANFSEAQVRRVLLEARATGPEIAAEHVPASAPTAEGGPLIAAVKKLIPKE